MRLVRSSSDTRKVCDNISTVRRNPGLHVDLKQYFTWMDWFHVGAHDPPSSSTFHAVTLEQPTDRAHWATLWAGVFLHGGNRSLTGGQCGRIKMRPIPNTTYNDGQTERMIMVRVEQLMKKDLVVVEAGTSIVEAAKLMKSYSVGSVLVSMKGRIVGIVTESDVVRKFVGAEKVPFFMPVEDIMSSPVVGIEANRPVTEAADLMDRHRTRHLGVTKAGALVGVVSVRDFLKPVAVDEL